MGPKELKETAELTVFLLDQDGPVPDDAERERRRGISRGSSARRNDPGQREFTPEAWAVWEVIFAKYAAPACATPPTTNPAPRAPPRQAQIDNDHRSLAQRQHDAMLVVGRSR